MNINKYYFKLAFLPLMLFFFLGSSSLSGYAQEQKKADNLIIVTLDGFRWHEVFNGMDSMLACNPHFNQLFRSALFKDYWSNSRDKRRQQLMPFLWTTVKEEGQIMGNRDWGNDVNVANPFHFSYPGYSEIFTGNVDTLINSNNYTYNPDDNFLDFFQSKLTFKDRIAAFCAWNAFPRILNRKRASYPIVAGFESCGGQNPDRDEQLINEMLRDSYKPFDDECLDSYTFYEAWDYLKKKHPRILYIGFGETDDWAHAGHYKDYLDAAHQQDQWLQKLWTFIQSDSFYKGKTLLFVTCDHGRGFSKPSEWTSHGPEIENSDETWFAIMGPGVKSKGEVKTQGKFYNKQFAQTLSNLLGFQFVSATHPVASPINLK